MREHISTTMPMPTLRRLSPAEKTRQRREEESPPPPHAPHAIETTDEPSPAMAVANSKPRALPRTVLPSDAFFVKVGTRLPPDLVDWLKQQVTEYRRRNPHAPRLTIEELLRIAIVDLRARGPVDKTIARYRSTVSASS
jgi:hypothetical protein